MSVKRARESLQGERPRKAPRRVEKVEEAKPVQVESARELRRLLHFRQDDIEGLRTGQASLKALLDPVVNHKPSDDDTDRSRRLSIAKECFQGEPTDLLQIWSFAASVDNERLVTATTSNLALLLRTFSSELELREQGLALGKSLLQREQLKLFSRGLSAESHKEAVISPCLRILSEIVSFDGGVLAGQVFRHQDYTFNSKFLDRNLRLHKAAGEEDRRKASVRTNTVRYILALLRHLDVDNKIALLSIRSVFRNLMDNVRNDPPEVFQDILKTVEISVLKNDDIPRKAKSSLVSERALVSIIDALRGLPEQVPAARVAWEFLHRICTIADLGVQLPSSWYPPSQDRNKEDLDYVPRQSDGADVRNVILSKFAQHLRPHSDLKERRLLMSMFQAAPELVMDYLRQATSRLSLQPKLTNTWIGYASLMYSIIDLPVPLFFGMSSYRSFPPAPTVIFENIIPSVLSADVLRRCMNQQSSLITFFALRILVIALQKAQVVLAKLQAGMKEHAAYEDLVTSFEYQLAQRLPAFKDVANTYRTIAKYDDSRMAQEAAAHVLSLYRRVAPDAVLDDFDIPGQVATVLEALQGSDLSDEDRHLLQLQLAHLLDLAQNSLSTLWWQRQGKMVYSPFVTILKLRADSPSSSATSDKLTGLLTAVAFEEGTLQSGTELSAMDALLASLESNKHWKACPGFWRFLDDCFSRLQKKPIKYLDDLDEMTGGKATPNVSLIALVVLEQIPFAAKLTDTDRETTLNWVNRLTKALQKIGEDKKITSALEKEIEIHAFSRSKVRLRAIRTRQERLDRVPNVNGTNTPQTQSADEKVAKVDRGLHVEFVEPSQESDKHPELTRYKRQDLEEVVQGETLDNLMLCLCSQYPEIRRQGVTALQDVKSKLEESSIDFKDQLWLLLGSLLETTTSSIEERPLSYVAGSFAVASRKVLLEPTHLLFPLVNKFLLKDPYWNVRKLPDYFLRKALLEPPAEDEAFWDQLEWILAFFIDGVRVVEDVLSLRNRNAFERILLLVHSPTVTARVTTLVLQLVHRVCTVSGSTMLITNAGLDAWLTGLECLPRTISASTLETMKKVTERTTDQERVDQWRGIEAGSAKVTNGLASAV
ncbi:hypothetical protein CAC42_4469 [Sphaceloma murrayae]|uniref:Nucleolar pre-ribosomal-associated protein 1 n=1 Tax=Sphaceloma murrayae TaxID=2082308 RepID=A0A2K1QLN2_9PEZI|nr:hypothetical protein CAC42_4469 [Sphaceloma murrayae]